MRLQFRKTTLAAALCVSGCDLYHASRAVDAGPAVDSSASTTPVSCDAREARKLLASPYDVAHHCFARRVPLTDVCMIPTHSPGGGGELQCFVSPAGEAYASYILYGETFNDPAWHHPVGPTLPSTLSESETALCASFWSDFQRVEEVATGTAADDKLLWDPNSSAELLPMCEASSE